MWTKEKMKKLTFWGIMMAALGPSVFSNHPWLGKIICLVGLSLLIFIKVRQRTNQKQAH